MRRLHVDIEENMDISIVTKLLMTISVVGGSEADNWAMPEPSGRLFSRDGITLSRIRGGESIRSLLRYSQGMAVVPLQVQVYLHYPY